MSINISRQRLIQNLKISLGWPKVSIELEDSQIEFAINVALDHYKRYATGNGLIRDYIIMNAKAGVSAYAMPDEVRSVLYHSYGEGGGFGNISTLFTMENYMYNAGMLNVFNWGSFGLVTYELSLQYLDLVKQMMPSPYFAQLNREEHTLIIRPVPTGTCDIFLEVYREVASDPLYENLWVFKWAKAECKEMLGYERRKYPKGAGGVGGPEDGDDMVKEAIAEKEVLQKRLLDQEARPLNFFIG